MTQTAEQRLQIARAAAGYPDAAAAARAMEIPEPTYQGHENGWRGLSRSAKRYAMFFGVSLDWLLRGKGDMRGRRRVIPVDGRIGVGALVEPLSDAESLEAPPDVELPAEGLLGAYLVRGDSQFPRFLDGEYILYEKTARKPKELVDQYAIVETLDGRKLIKIIRAYGSGNLWRLEAHNAPPETVELLSAWRYVGAIAPKGPATIKA